MILTGTDDEDAHRKESPFDRELTALVAPSDWENPIPPPGRYNLLVLGAGTAGLVCAAGAAGLGAKVALVEARGLGGDCLNDGCVPSKAILRAARAAAEARNAGALGVILSGSVSVDFSAVMERMRSLRAGIARHDSAERFRSLGVDVTFGLGKFTGTDTLEVGGRTLRFARAVIATGARAAVPKIPGLDRVRFLTNESIFNLRTLPRRLVIVGAGPIGAELAQAFRRFGSEVHLVNRSLRFLPKEEPEAADVVRRTLEREGVGFHLGVKILSVESGPENLFTLIFEREGRRETLEGDALLLATGRAANVDNMGLDVAGVAYDRAGVHVNDYLQTSNPRIYAAGDVCSAYKFTHAADAMARIVLRNALFFGTAKMSRLVIPWCTYTDPELAHVGLTASQAREQGVAFDTFTQSFEGVDRAVLDGRTEGFATVLVRKGRDQILGATIVAPHAGDLIAGLSLAMTQGLGLGVFASTILPYPTQAEVLKKLGDAIMKTKLTPRAVRFLKGIMKWRR